MQLLFVIVWTWLLNFICTNGFTVVSWILVLLPFVLLIVLMIFGTVAMSKLSPDQIDQLMKDE
jgi:ABC-type Na+ efflux pump permease subunit